jgi:hypothetical protein
MTFSTADSNAAIPDTFNTVVKCPANDASEESSRRALDRTANGLPPNRVFISACKTREFLRQSSTVNHIKGKTSAEDRCPDNAASVRAFVEKLMLGEDTSVNLLCYPDIRGVGDVNGWPFETDQILLYFFDDIVKVTPGLASKSRM